MKATVLLLIILLSLVSCTKSRSAETLILVAQESNTQLAEKKHLGDQHLNELRFEVITTKNNPLAQEKLNKIHEVMKQIDSISMKAIAELDQLKKTILNFTNETHLITDSLCTPIYINYYNIKNPNSTSVIKKTLNCNQSKELSPILNKLNQTLRQLPNKLLNATCNHNDQKPNFPIIQGFKSQDELTNLLNKKMDARSYNEKEDKQFVLDIYTLLAKNQNQHTIHWLNNYLINTTTIEAFIRINILQVDILQARKLALAQTSARVNHCGYGFTEIIPLVIGPSTIKTGDTAIIKVGIGAFDETNNPTIKLSKNDRVKIEYKNGLAHIHFPAKKGKQTIQGTVTIINQSGIPKTLPFQWTTTGQ